MHPQVLHSQLEGSQEEHGLCRAASLRRAADQGAADPESAFASRSPPFFGCKGGVLATLAGIGSGSLGKTRRPPARRGLITTTSPSTRPESIVATRSFVELIWTSCVSYPSSRRTRLKNLPWC